MTARSMLNRIRRLERAKAPVECAVCKGHGGVPAFGFEGRDMPSEGRPCRACGRPGRLIIFSIVDRAEGGGIALDGCPNPL